VHNGLLGEMDVREAAITAITSQVETARTNLHALLDGKQPLLTFDTIPVSASTNSLTSGSIYTALEEKQDLLTFDTNPTLNSTNPVTSGGVYTALAGKQDAFTLDSVPTLNSTNPVTSGGVYTALAGKQNAFTLDSTPLNDSVNPITSGGVYTALAGKQDVLTFDTTPTLASTNPVTSGGVKLALDGKQNSITSSTNVQCGSITTSGDINAGSNFLTFATADASDYAHISTFNSGSTTTRLRIVTGNDSEDEIVLGRRVNSNINSVLSFIQCIGTSDTSGAYNGITNINGSTRCSSDWTASFTENSDPGDGNRRVFIRNTNTSDTSGKLYSQIHFTVGSGLTTGPRAVGDLMFVREGSGLASYNFGAFNGSNYRTMLRLHPTESYIQDGNVSIGTTTNPNAYRLNVNGSIGCGSITTSGAVNLGTNPYYTLTCGAITANGTITTNSLITGGSIAIQNTQATPTFSSGTLTIALGTASFGYHSHTMSADITAFAFTGGRTNAQHTIYVTGHASTNYNLSTSLGANIKTNYNSTQVITANSKNIIILRWDGTTYYITFYPYY
jgi:hypothetical protein